MEKNQGLTDLQLLHQQQMREKRESIKRRKARTHRLIVRGAIAENAIEGSADMTDEQFQQMLYQLIYRASDIAHSSLQESLGRASQESPSEDSCGSNPR